MTKSRFFDATIYPKRSAVGETKVGVTFHPTPSLSEDDLKQLVHDLTILALDVRIESIEAAEITVSEDEARPCA